MRQILIILLISVFVPLQANAQNCSLDPSKCNDYILCVKAAPTLGMSKQWSPAEIMQPYVLEAKSRGLKCGVGENSTSTTSWAEAVSARVKELDGYSNYLRIFGIHPKHTDSQVIQRAQSIGLICRTVTRPSYQILCDYGGMPAIDIDTEKIIFGCTLFNGCRNFRPHELAYELEKAGVGSNFSQHEPWDKSISEVWCSDNGQNLILCAANITSYWRGVQKNILIMFRDKNKNMSFQ